MKILGQDIPPLGMGCWVIGGPFYKDDVPLAFGEVDDAESTRTIHAALDAGIRLFDTAAAYGTGHSERVLGAALKGRPDVLVVSKIGMKMDEQSKQLLDDDTDPANVEPAIDGCLGRLQRDCIDVMLLHLNDLPMDKASPIFEVMEKIRKAGKIRSYGWSTDFPASATAMAGFEGFIGIEHATNVFIDAPAMRSVIEHEQLVALIRSPLAMGVLTGKFDAATTLPADDHRSVNADWRDYFHDRKVTPKYLKNLDAVRELLKTDGRTLAQGALCWLLAKSAQNLPVPGARTVEQVRDNAGAIGFGPLPTDVMSEIEILIEREPEGKSRAR